MGPARVQGFTTKRREARWRPGRLRLRQTPSRSHGIIPRRCAVHMPALGEYSRVPRQYTCTQTGLLGQAEMADGVDLRGTRLRL
jgi:hypothetical protein